SKFDEASWHARPIVTARHCFGCTAGAGSSCGGQKTRNPRHAISLGQSALGPRGTGHPHGGSRHHRRPLDIWPLQPGRHRCSGTHSRLLVSRSAVARPCVSTHLTGRMLDATLRQWIDRPIALAGRKLAFAGIGADNVSVLGLAFGIASALAIALGHFWIGLTLFLLNRLADGLDGAVARATTRTDRGGFLDITFDFLVYGAIPLAFA